MRRVKRGKRTYLWAAERTPAPERVPAPKATRFEELDEQTRRLILRLRAQGKVFNVVADMLGLADPRAPRHARGARVLAWWQRLARGRS